MDCVPLAFWDPNGDLDLDTKEGVPVGNLLEEDMDPSEWMRTMIKGFGKFVGFPIAFYESRFIAFFEQLERVWEAQAAVVNTH